MSQVEYYTNLLCFTLNLAGISIALGLGAALVWYWWTLGRFLK